MDTNPKPSFSCGGLFLNVLTALTILATFAAIGIVGVLFFNPQLPFNPFPPPTGLPTTPGPSPTGTPELPLPPVSDTPQVPPSSETPTTAEPTASATALPPTLTVVAPTATATPTPLPPAHTPTPTATPPSFVLQAGSPAALQRWWPPYDQLCQWMGVGGQAFDLDGKPIIGLTIYLEGVLGNVPIVLTQLTGSAKDLLGESGYILDLANQPIASQGTLWMQVIDISTGQPLSDKFYLTTYDVCEKNFILVNWRKTR